MEYVIGVVQSRGVESSVASIIRVSCKHLQSISYRSEVGAMSFFPAWDVRSHVL